MALSTSTQNEMTALPKREYKGASRTPSLVIRNNHIDSTIWNDIELSDNDIYVNTPAKCGTTWMQEICGQLLYNGDMPGRIGTDRIHDISPWIAMAIAPREHTIKSLKDQLENENIKRRLFKTHEPIESMPYNPNCKYIFVARDFRDICWSLYNHYSLFSEKAYEVFHAPRDYEFESFPHFNFEDGSFTEKDFFDMSVDGATPDDDNPDGAPFWSQLWVTGSWWNVRDLPNVKLVHFQNMKDDLPGSYFRYVQYNNGYGICCFVRNN